MPKKNSTVSGLTAAQCAERAVLLQQVLQCCQDTLAAILEHTHFVQTMGRSVAQVRGVYADMFEHYDRRLKAGSDFVKLSGELVALQASLMDALDFCRSGHGLLAETQLTFALAARSPEMRDSVEQLLLGMFHAGSQNTLDTVVASSCRN